MGEDDRVYEEIRSPGYAEDTVDSPGLTWLGREAAAVAAWLRPDVADDLSARYGSEEPSERGLLPEDFLSVAREAGPAYRSWLEAFESLAVGAPRALAHYVGLLRSLVDPEGKRGRAEVGDVDPERTFRGLAAVERALPRNSRRPRELARLLAEMILELPVGPVWVHRCLETRRLRFGSRFRREVAHACATPALAAFYWTRMLGMPVVRS